MVCSRLYQVTSITNPTIFVYRSQFDEICILRVEFRSNFVTKMTIESNVRTGPPGQLLPSKSDPAKAARGPWKLADVVEKLEEVGLGPRAGELGEN